MSKVYDYFYVSQAVKDRIKEIFKLDDDVGLQDFIDGSLTDEFLDDLKKRDPRKPFYLPLQDGVSIRCEMNGIPGHQKFAMTRVIIGDDKGSSDNKEGLLGFVYFPGGKSGISNMLNNVANVALKENWTSQNSNYENDILWNYLNQTYIFLRNKGKVKKSSDGSLSAFNTGLADSNYDDICMVFQKVENLPTLEWRYLAVTTKRMNDGKKYLDKFPKLPERAKYCEIDELAASPGKVIDDFEHILSDNFDRFPPEFIKRELSGIDKFSDRMDSSDSGAIKDLVLNDMDCRRKISNAFRTAVVMSEKRWRWNFKTAVPIYYPTAEKIQFLLPLSFSTDFNVVDVALVIDKIEARSDEYRGVTILTTDMAYKDARLVCRPDSDWLNDCRKGCREQDAAIKRCSGIQLGENDGHPISRKGLLRLGFIGKVIFSRKHRRGQSRNS